MAAPLVNSVRSVFRVLNDARLNTPGILIPVRGKKYFPRPKLRVPQWFTKKDRTKYSEHLTPENSLFVKEVIEDKYGSPTIVDDIVSYSRSPLRNEPMERGEFSDRTKRTGLIARKIGVYPMWLKDGKKVATTLFQVVDNHVIKYIPPGEFDPPRKPDIVVKRPDRYGCLLVGAESMDPCKLTKEYCGLFVDSGVMPKNVLKRFIVSPEAAIQPGTPLYASHFQVGQHIDIVGLTIDRGYQGVMKRWGFHGGPASHGCTKTHRRPGNIGSGGGKARVWPGQKMPGHMGNRWRYLRGQEILRINTKYNVIWIKGQAIPGAIGSVCYLYDTLLPHRKIKPVYFPTFYPEDLQKPLPEEMYADKVHQFSEPTITYDEK